MDKWVGPEWNRKEPKKEVMEEKKLGIAQKLLSELDGLYERNWERIYEIMCE